MSAGSYNILAEQGATFSRVLTWNDSNGSPVNLTGFTARMQVRPTYASSTVVIELSTTNGRITLGGALGTVTLGITATDTDALNNGKYVYDLELVSGGGQVTRLLQGIFEVSPQVTK